MNIESPQLAPQESNEQPNTAKEKRKMAYAEALEVFKSHDGAEIEAEQLLFRERIAKTGPEAAIAGLELKIDAAQEQKDIYAEKGEPFTEEAWAVRVQFLTGMRDVFSLYCDMREKSPEMAQYMEEDMPWLNNTLEKAEEMIQETIADDYQEGGVDEDYR